MASLYTQAADRARLAALVERIVNPPEGNVVALAESAPRRTRTRRAR
jgi:hypothetical protein